MARPTSPMAVRSPRWRSITAEDGATSLEAAVAAVLLSAVLVPLGLFVMSRTLDARTERSARALAVAESLVERSAAHPVPLRDSLRIGTVTVRRVVKVEPSGVWAIDVEAYVRARASEAGAPRGPVLLRLRTHTLSPLPISPTSPPLP